MDVDDGPASGDSCVQRLSSFCGWSEVSCSPGLHCALMASSFLPFQDPWPWGPGETPSGLYLLSLSSRLIVESIELKSFTRVFGIMCVIIYWHVFIHSRFVICKKLGKEIDIMLVE